MIKRYLFNSVADCVNALRSVCLTADILQKFLSDLIYHDSVKLILF